MNMLWTAGAAALCLLVCLPLFFFHKKALRYRLAACYKSLGTLCAAVPALVAAIRLDPRCWICFAGLMLHAAADWLLEFSLFRGAGLFMAGHVCYIAFFTGLFPVTAVHLFCAVCLLGCSAFLLYRWRKQIGKRMSLFAVYAGVLCLMTACAVASLTGRTLQGQLIAIGGSVFFLSDLMLLGKLLFPVSRWMERAVMISYYIAQLLIGISCLV